MTFQTLIFLTIITITITIIIIKLSIINHFSPYHSPQAYSQLSKDHPLFQ